MTSDFNYLFAYTDWERSQWERWFRADGREAFAVGMGPNANTQIGTVGELVRHIFAAEQRFVERIQSLPLSDANGVPANDVDALFALGRDTRKHMMELLRDLPSDRWELPMELQFGPRKAMLLPKTMVVQSLTHEIRHWAQIATLLRMAGHKVGSHDFLFSGIFERDLVH
jgi:uncharacterized damage-inducible protein DinB